MTDRRRVGVAPSRSRSFSRSRWWFLAVVLTLILPSPAGADMGPPVHLQISETEDGLYTVRWRVPKALPPRAVPTPMLPESCRPTTDPTVTNQPAAWLVEADWRCETSLAGQTVGMDYPYPDLSLTTVVRVDLLSGDRFAHILGQGEESWQLPEGTAAPDILKDLRRSTMAGASHALFSPIHLLFLVTVALVGGVRRTLGLVTALALGQVAGVLASSLFVGIGAAAAQIAFAIGVVVIARQVLEPDVHRRRLWVPAAVAGFAHGLGLATMLGNDLGERGTGLVALLLAVLGMDAFHLLFGTALTALLATIVGRPEPARLRRLMPYGVGATGVAMALALAMQGGVVQTDATAASVMMPVETATGDPTGAQGSRRVAPSAPNASIQTFLSVEPFEVRHEVMLRLAGVVGELDLDPNSTLEIGAQGAIAERLTRLILDNTTTRINGENAEGLIRRADFMTVDLTGALPRPNPVEETVADAVMGVIVAYPTSGMPRSVELEWRTFPSAMEAIPATVIDPENVTSRTLSPAEPALTWQYALAEDPVPTVEAVEILEATEIAPQDRGFGVRAVWTVGGTVTHFGHRHFRQNRYNAELQGFFDERKED